ncbi:DUF4232 domain-containing protein [Streptomyces erythrochromogenes]|uniref:DUF4232 domain-containing protein n=1 Tax=Streptomyces erythrochromogenes TaxID=285574 RepID=UPI0034231999
MISKRWVRGVVAAGVLAGAAACSAPPAPGPAPGPVRAERPGGTVPTPRLASPSAPPSASAGACPEGGVRLLETGGDAAMGLRVVGFQLLNCGTQAYVLEGYPEVSLRDDRNEPVEVAVQHGAAGITTGVPNIDAAPQRVTLAPGQAAAWWVVWRNLVTDSAVPATTVSALEVEPRPGAPRLWLRPARPFDLGNTGRLGIGPWTAAAR